MYKLNISVKLRCNEIDWTWRVVIWMMSCGFVIDCHSHHSRQIKKTRKKIFNQTLRQIMSNSRNVMKVQKICPSDQVMQWKVLKWCPWFTKGLGKERCVLYLVFVCSRHFPAVWKTPFFNSTISWWRTLSIKGNV